jgi:hypothetical protein
MELLLSQMLTTNLSGGFFIKLIEKSQQKREVMNFGLVTLRKKGGYRGCGENYRPDEYRDCLRD